MNKKLSSNVNRELETRITNQMGEQEKEYFNMT